ncbi:DNA-binding response OmpR family regulator [Paraburkholderia sp. WSM4179]|nr:DNA-binding response OmpR family regulator [Paraburkholderia sp. WSM4179]
MLSDFACAPFNKLTIATNVIDVHISRLRKKLDPDGTAPMIDTVRGSGYMLCA